MVVGAFPVAKLGGLILKQVSKPIANILKERAKRSHFFRTYVCMPPAQSQVFPLAKLAFLFVKQIARPTSRFIERKAMQIYNWCEVKAKMWIMNLGRPVNIPSLNEQMAIELGANLLGEGIIFTIAAAILYLEYARSARKEAAKEQARLDEMETLNYTIRELYFQAERQDAQIRELMRTVCELESQVTKKPKKCADDGEMHMHPAEPQLFEGGFIMEAIQHLHNFQKNR
ncbi:hypothetical protein J437_LFUL009367 [Ladona fulva]|uniref:OPA3-like protein n=1 Tax=Ladona fulva TaxID=123851 RepID=A0A8K0P0H2_LADFU|nr:hypothetical protein J437_LFUL009367 [Ladona fulva]